MLTNVKENIPHGAFTEWVKNNCVFKSDTAIRYMNLFRYNCKNRNLRNLQEAYKLIEAEQKKEKAREENLRGVLFKERKKTGKKPDGWTRDLDYAWDKYIKEETARDERIKKLVEDEKKRVEEKKKNKVDYFGEIEKILKQQQKSIDIAQKVQGNE